MSFTFMRIVVQPIFFINHNYNSYWLIDIYIFYLHYLSVYWREVEKKRRNVADPGKIQTAKIVRSRNLTKHTWA